MRVSDLVDRLQEESPDAEVLLVYWADGALMEADIGDITSEEDGTIVLLIEGNSE